MLSPMMRTLCLEMCRIREDSTLSKVMMSVSSLELVRLYPGTTFHRELPLTVAHVLFMWILCMPFNDFKAQGLRNFPKPLILALI